jgi:hypothetical protein
MDEDIKAEIGRAPPEGPQALGIECLTLQLGRDDDAWKSEVDGTALELPLRLGGSQCGNMRKPNETPRMIIDRLLDPIVDQAADRQVRLIETGAAGENTCIDAGAIHHPDVGIEIGQQRIEQIVGIAVLVQTHRNAAALLQELGRRVVLLEIDDH